LRRGASRPQMGQGARKTDRRLDCEGGGQASTTPRPQSRQRQLGACPGSIQMCCSKRDAIRRACSLRRQRSTSLAVSRPSTNTRDRGHVLPPVVVQQPRRASLRVQMQPRRVTPRACASNSSRRLSSPHFQGLVPRRCGLGLLDRSKHTTYIAGWVQPCVPKRARGGERRLAGWRCCTAPAVGLGNRPRRHRWLGPKRARGGRDGWLRCCTGPAVGRLGNRPPTARVETTLRSAVSAYAEGLG
jgi:hypothetical protein